MFNLITANLGGLLGSLSENSDRGVVEGEKRKNHKWEVLSWLGKSRAIRTTKEGLGEKWNYFQTFYKSNYLED